MDELRIKCPKLTCRKVLAVPSSSRGKNVRCKNCGATIRVPERASPPPTPVGKKSETAPAAAGAQKAA